MGPSEPADRGEAVRRWRALLGRSRSRPRPMGVAQPLAPPLVPPPLAPTLVPPPQRVGEMPPPPVQPAAPPLPAALVGTVPIPQALEVIRAHVGRPKAVAFVNPKGGVHKTTATVLAAATLGSVRGGGVLAWDDNELRGTLGLRAGTARHARTIKHLIGDLPGVESAVTSGQPIQDVLENYLRHSSDGSFDVLAGDEDPRVARHLNPDVVQRLMRLLTSAYDIVCVDTGNNVESANWKTVIQQSDRMVVTTLPREDAAFTADWMLDLLEEDGHADLVADAVTVLSCPSPVRSPLLEELVEHFAQRTRAVAVIPYDPALESGSTIAFSKIADATRRAWLDASAALVQGWGR
ncbi:MinD/ParA family protein [Cryptosporangium sp. NPDC048952]|uniref:MinD/ParA family ATP-binding protein n=1 Tax=Cryptosporangium sp. NPDC048952 TaxID=3363961 RepID=UPI0037203621